MILLLVDSLAALAIKVGMPANLQDTRKWGVMPSQHASCYILSLPVIDLHSNSFAHQQPSTCTSPVRRLRSQEY